MRSVLRPRSSGRLHYRTPPRSGPESSGAPMPCAIRAARRVARIRYRPCQRTGRRQPPCGRAARIDERIDRQVMAVLAEPVDRQRLVEDVLEQRLQPRVALATGAAAVRLDRAAAVVEIVQHDREILRELRIRLREVVEVLD